MLGCWRRFARRDFPCSRSSAGLIISIPRFMPRRPGALRSTSIAGRCSRRSLPLLMQAADGADLVLAEGSMGLFDGVARPARPEPAPAPISPRWRAGPWCWCSMCPARRNRRRRSRSALRRCEKMSRSRASCSIAWRARATRRWRAPAWKPPAFACSARCRDGDRSRCPSAISASCRPKSSLRLAQILTEMADFIAAHVDLAALRAIAGADANGGCRRLPQDSSAGQPGGAGARCGVLLHLSAFAGGMARGRRGDLAVLTIGRRSAGPSADACWLPGGYPELHAGRLAAATRFRCGPAKLCRDTNRCMASAAATWRMGECLIDASGARHEMAGFFKLTTSFEKRRMHLGYRLARSGLADSRSPRRRAVART